METERLRNEKKTPENAAHLGNTCGKIPMGEEDLLVSHGLIQGSDGRGDRGALFHQAKSCFPRECRTAPRLCWHLELSAMTQWLPTGAPSAPMSIYTLKTFLLLLKGTLH